MKTWEYHGQKRPPFAQQPLPGQESVWDYPRPPLLEPSNRLVVVEANGDTLAHSTNTFRVMETASPPGFYIPEQDIDWDKLTPAPGSSVCEWKGVAKYWRLASQPDGKAVAWSYPEPIAAFGVLRGYVSFYPGRVDCYVDGEKVRPQPGEFYGGWVTDDIVGPFKGAPDTRHW
ncbi:MAG: DUF427 domain-containing protein [Burkholderiales bacterium]|jgi:uncharacterized protein (DUF427 family)